jgi:hypothetical protein
VESPVGMVMKIAKLFFPGIYEDAYVYMGKLFI